ncbi:hypothetical protein [Streptomyces sp. H34-S4]|uniref:hypothetical protein n=1 Tax=Streptomyces sp. H34-S4 TaxID=2996463 RepID=UPI0022714AAB|nr:hypothetical protein [Streptomyces sp. H34-S4]MCY0936914.1 hypothetical protein [Streptomyces sp. H34-S4]
MPDQKPASVKVNGTVFKFTLADVEAAASRLVPAHHTSLDGEWYALVGSGLHYVRPLVAEASKAPKDVSVKDARLALHSLGVTLFGWAGHEMIEKGLPGHR